MTSFKFVLWYDIPVMIGFKLVKTTESLSVKCGYITCSAHPFAIDLCRPRPEGNNSGV